MSHALQRPFNNEPDMCMQMNAFECYSGVPFEPCYGHPPPGSNRTTFQCCNLRFSLFFVSGLQKRGEIHTLNALGFRPSHYDPVLLYRAGINLR